MRVVLAKNAHARTQMALLRPQTTPLSLNSWVRSLTFDQSREVGDLGSFFAADEAGGITRIQVQPLAQSPGQSQQADARCAMAQCQRLANGRLGLCMGMLGVGSTSCTYHHHHHHLYTSSSGRSVGCMSTLLKQHSNTRKHESRTMACKSSSTTHMHLCTNIRTYAHALCSKHY